MKKTLSLILAFALLLTMGACTGAPTVPEGSGGTPSNPASPAAAVSNDSPLVGDSSETYYMLAFLSGIDYWKGCFKGFTEAADKYGVSVEYAGYSDADVNQNVAVFEQVLAKKPAGIAVTCINADAYEDPINRAIEMGIPVVCYDSDSANSNRLSYLSTGNKAAGEAAADYFGTTLLPSGGKIAMLYTVGQPNVEERVIGFEGKIKEKYPNITISAKVNDKGDQAEATKAMAAALQADPSINGVFCMDGVAGVAGATAVRESGITGIKVIGFDTDAALLDMIKDGSVSATVAQGTYNMGYWSLNFLFQAKHKLPSVALPGFVDTGVTIVGPDKVDDYYVK